MSDILYTESIGPDGPSITCPKCGKTSYHPKDVEEKYCGNCHEFQSAMAVLSPGECVELPEPNNLVDAIENALREASFLCFGVHATVDVVKRHMDEFIVKWEKVKL